MVGSEASWTNSDTVFQVIGFLFFFLSVMIVNHEMSRHIHPKSSKKIVIMSSCHMNRLLEFKKENNEGGEVDAIF